MVSPGIMRSLSAILFLIFAWQLSLPAQRGLPCEDLMEPHAQVGERPVFRSRPLVLVVRGQYSYSIVLMRNEAGWMAQFFSRQGQNLQSGDELIFVDAVGERRSFTFVGQSRTRSDRGVPIFSNLLEMEASGLLWLANADLRTLLLRNNQKHEMRNFPIYESRAREFQRLTRCMLELDEMETPGGLRGEQNADSRAEEEAALELRLQILRQQVEEEEARAAAVLDSLEQVIRTARERAEQVKRSFADSLLAEKARAERAIDSLHQATVKKLALQEQRAQDRREALFQEIQQAHVSADEAIRRTRAEAEQAIEDIRKASRLRRDSLQMQLEEALAFYDQEVDRARAAADQKVETIRQEAENELDKVSNLDAERRNLREQAVREREKLDLELAEARRQFAADRARLAEQHELELARLKEDMVRERESLALEQEAARRGLADSLLAFQEEILAERNRLEEELLKARRNTEEARLASLLGRREAEERLSLARQSTAESLRDLKIWEEREIEAIRDRVEAYRDSLQRERERVEEETRKAVARSRADRELAEQTAEQRQIELQAATEQAILQARREAEETLAAIERENNERVAEAKQAAEQAEEKYRQEVAKAAERAARRITRIHKNTEYLLAELEAGQARNDLLDAIETQKAEVRRFEREEQDLAASRRDASQVLAEEKEANARLLSDLKEQGALQQQRLLESIALERQESMAAWREEEARLQARRDSLSGALALEMAALEKELLLEKDRSARLILKIQEDAYAEVDALMTEKAAALAKVRNDWQRELAAAREAGQDSLASLERQLARERSRLEEEYLLESQHLAREIDQLRHDNEQARLRLVREGLQERARLREEIDRQLVAEQARLDTLKREIKAAEEKLKQTKNRNGTEKQGGENNR